MLALLSLFSLLNAAPVYPAERVQIQADEINYDSVAGVSHATGHVIVTTPDFILRAPALNDDTRTQRLTVEGPLFAIDGLNVLLARRAVMNLETGELDLFDFVLHQKERVSAAALAKAQTGAEAAALGQDHAVIYGKQLARLGPAHYRIDGLELTPCQCAGGCTAAWSMTASHADVLAGERAVLTWPVFRIAEIPVVPLPALYVPLADRRTGFLLPHVNWQRQNGLLLDEPFYVTLGRSADITVTPGFISGEGENLNGWGANGVYGPRVSLELRYAPTNDTEGRIFASVLDDLHHDFDQNGVGYVRGPRESLHLWHLQGDLDDGGRWGDRADISLVTDAKLTSQLTTDILFASIPATRSAADAFWRGDDWLVALDAVFYQDFQGYFADTNVHELLFGPGSPAPLATAPRLQADFDDRRLGPVPIWFSLQSSLSREAALGPAYDQVTLGPPPLGLMGSTPGTIPVSPSQPGRAAVDHFDLFPSLTLPINFGRFATASVKASWREDLWSFESNPDPDNPAVGQSWGQTGQRGYPLIDAELGTKLSRSWTSGWTHSIAPEVEARYLPAIETSGLVPPVWLIPAAGNVFDHATGLAFARAIPLPYDELDFAPGYGGPPLITPGTLGTLQRGTLPTGFAQGVLHIDQRLRGPRVQARLDVGEYVDDGGFEATYAQLQSTFGQFHANGYTLFSNQPTPCPGCTQATSDVRRLEEATVDIGWADPRGDAASVTFVRALAAGSAILNSPVDALFAPPLPSNDPRWTLPDVSQAGVGATARIWDGIFVHAGMTYLVPAATPIQILAGAGYHSAQNCLVLDGNLVLQPPQAGSPLTVTAFFVTFDLGEIGGGGSL
jgi:LPS-assembly protein